MKKKKITDARKFSPGDRVIYKPSWSIDDVTSWEFWRVIVNGANKFVFVLFRNEKHAKATHENLLFIDESCHQAIDEAIREERK